MDQNLPTYSAQLAYPPGLDETRLAVYDGNALAAETTWRASGNYRPGPAKWDYELHRLGVLSHLAVAARRTWVRLQRGADHPRTGYGSRLVSGELAAEAEGYGRLHCRSTRR